MNARTLLDSFFAGDEVSTGYRKSYVEIFLNPTSKEEAAITQDGHYGAFVTEEGALYAFDRRLGMHAPVARKLIPQHRGMVGLLIYKTGQTEYELYVTDFTRFSEWLHSPKLKDFLEDDVPFFKGKDITISYFDENVEGPWHGDYHSPKEADDEGVPKA